MKQLRGLFEKNDAVRFSRSFAAACAVAASIGVALTASGNAHAQEYSRTSGVMPAQMVKVLDVRALSRDVSEQRSSFNTSRVVGGALGGLIGNRMTKNQGKGTTVGTLLGAAFGQAIGDSVDKQLAHHEVPVAEITFARVGDQSGKVYVVLQDYHDGLKDCTPGTTALLLNDREISRCIVSPSNFARPGAAPARAQPVPGTGQPAAPSNPQAAPVTLATAAADLKSLFNKIPFPSAPSSEAKDADPAPSLNEAGQTNTYASIDASEIKAFFNKLSTPSWAGEAEAPQQQSANTPSAVNAPLSAADVKDVFDKISKPSATPAPKSGEMKVAVKRVKTPNVGM